MDVDSTPDAILAEPWARELAEQWGETALHWLLARRLDEPEEKVFALADNRLQRTSMTLTEEEVRLGSRHMLGGVVADDLADFIEEEIVLTSVDDSRGIYDSQPREVESRPEAARHEFIAVRHLQTRSRQDRSVDRSHLEGVDLLNLGPPPAVLYAQAAGQEADLAAAVAAVAAADSVTRLEGATVEPALQLPAEPEPLPTLDFEPEPEPQPELEPEPESELELEAESALELQPA
ncbi:MAG: hypothetical protein ACNA7T_04860, partial [Haliea sp.]